MLLFRAGKIYSVHTKATLANLKYRAVDFLLA